MEARETVDTVTGELLESVHVLANPARASDEGQRLDRVRDIETLVTLAETAGDDEVELVDLTLRGQRRRVRSADRGCRSVYRARKGRPLG